MISVAQPIDAELLRKFDVSGPRYTSYPTADRFVEAFGADDYAQALMQRRSGAAALALPLSLFVNLCVITAHATKSSPSTMIVRHRICVT